MEKVLVNARHNFGYIQLPLVIDTLFPEDKEEICWSPSALIEREIFKSEVDVMFRFGLEGELRYLGKATELKTGVSQRFLRIDTTNCPERVFEILKEYVLVNRPVGIYSPYLASMHINSVITDVHLRATTLHEEETGRPVDTVLNMVVITLAE